MPTPEPEPEEHEDEWCFIRLEYVDPRYGHRNMETMSCRAVFGDLFELQNVVARLAGSQIGRVEFKGFGVELDQEWDMHTDSGIKQQALRRIASAVEFARSFAREEIPGDSHYHYNNFPENL